MTGRLGFSNLTIFVPVFSKVQVLGHAVRPQKCGASSMAARCFLGEVPLKLGELKCKDLVWRLGGFTPQSFWNKILTFDPRNVFDFLLLTVFFVAFLKLKATIWTIWYKTRPLPVINGVKYIFYE